MDAVVQWWELRLPRTNRNSIDAWVRIERARMKVAVMSEKAQQGSSEAMEELRWASSEVKLPSPAYPWKRARGRQFAWLEAAHRAGRSPYSVPRPGFRNLPGELGLNGEHPFPRRFPDFEKLFLPFLQPLGFLNEQLHFPNQSRRCN
jgi:hypothetical protein